MTINHNKVRPVVWFLRAIREDFTKRRRDAEALYMAHEHFNRFEAMQRMGQWIDFYTNVDRIAVAGLKICATGGMDALLEAIQEDVRAISATLRIVRSESLDTGKAVNAAATVKPEVY